jgi:hypothetical protein
MLLIPIPLRTTTHRRVAAVLFLGLLAAGYVWLATLTAARYRPRTPAEWAGSILVVAVFLGVFRWVVRFPRRLLRNEPLPSILPRAKGKDRDRDHA